MIGEKIGKAISSQIAWAITTASNNSSQQHGSTIHMASVTVRVATASGFLKEVATYHHQTIRDVVSSIAHDLGDEITGVYHHNRPVHADTPISHLASASPSPHLPIDVFVELRQRQGAFPPTKSRIFAHFDDAELHRSTPDSGAGSAGAQASQGYFATPPYPERQHQSTHADDYLGVPPTGAHVVGGYSAPGPASPHYLPYSPPQPASSSPGSFLGAMDDPPPYAPHQPRGLPFNPSQYAAEHPGHQLHPPAYAGEMPAPQMHPHPYGGYSAPQQAAYLEERPHHGRVHEAAYAAPVGQSAYARDEAEQVRIASMRDVRRYAGACNSCDTVSMEHARCVVRHYEH